MLTLVEPSIMGYILDRPHLGCAMLISACLKKGIKTTLIKGQTRYLKDMFVNDSEELWGLIQDLKDSDLKKINIAEYRKSIQEKGIKQFQYELNNIYQDAIIDKNPRNYFNVRIIEKFIDLNNIFVAIYFYYLTKLNRSKLKIIDHYISEIIKSNPRYIGFSLQGDFEPLSRIIRKRIKELTDIPIIVGGALTPFIDLRKLNKTFEEEYFDYLVIGAGEHALPSLIEALDNKKEPKGIANVFYKKDSKIKGNDLEVINDLDSLPYPDYSQFDLDLYMTPKRILPLQTARGCSWRRCTFCNYSCISLGTLKTFSVEKTIEIISYLQSTYNCQHFHFHDDDFPSIRAKRISEAILDSKLKNLFFATWVRLEEGYNNEKLLRIMRKAGFTVLIWGMESGSQRVLDLMNKGVNIFTMSQILKKSSKAKIINICMIFFGFPGEAKEEAQETVEFLKKHADYIESITPGGFILSPFSIISNNPKKWNVEIKDNGSYSTNNGMSPKEAKEFLIRLMYTLEINNAKIISNKLKFFQQYSLLYFVITSYEILSAVVLLKCLKEGRLNKIFPIILGEIKKKSNRNIFRPINIKETSFIQQCYPEKERVLDRLEEKIFILSDGTLSVENIILNIYMEFKKEYRKKYIHNKCLDFFQDIFSKNWGLCFAKSWRLS